MTREFCELLGNHISKAALSKTKVSTTTVFQLQNQKYACLSSGIFAEGKVQIIVLTSYNNCHLRFYLGGHTRALRDGCPGFLLLVL